MQSNRRWIFIVLLEYMDFIKKTGSVVEHQSYLIVKECSRKNPFYSLTYYSVMDFILFVNPLLWDDKYAPI